MLGRNMQWDAYDGRFTRVKRNGADKERMGERKKVNATDVIGFRAIQTWRERQSRINLNIKGVDNHMETSSVIY
jgi:hypothetical protein